MSTAVLFGANPLRQALGGRGSAVDDVRGEEEKEGDAATLDDTAKAGDGAVVIMGSIPMIDQGQVV